MEGSGVHIFQLGLKIVRNHVKERIQACRHVLAIYIGIL